MSHELTPKQQQAAVMVARAERTNEAIAVELGIARKTLTRWSQIPEFAVAVEVEAERIREAIRAEGIANRQNRIDSANRRHQLMEQVLAARAEANRRRMAMVDAQTIEQIGELIHEGRLAPNDAIDFDGYAAAGAETGILVLTTTYLKDGKREEWAFDAALFKELREHEKQVAQDAGQWTEKREVSGKDGERFIFTMNVDETGVYDRLTAQDS